MGIGFGKNGACVDCIKCGKVLLKQGYKKDINEISDYMYFKTFDELIKRVKEENWETDLTEDSLKDFTNSDVAMFLGKNPDQLVDAIKLYEDVRKENPNAKITLTGHSLGGMLATQVALDSYKKQMIRLNGVNKENFISFVTI